MATADASHAPSEPAAGLAPEPTIGAVTSADAPATADASDALSEPAAGLAPEPTIGAVTSADAPATPLTLTPPEAVSGALPELAASLAARASALSLASTLAIEKSDLRA